MIKYIAELVAFVLIVFIIVRYIVPRITPMLGRRQDVIDKQVDDAEQARAKLAEAERSFQSALTEARTEAAQIRENARADAQRTIEDLQAQARDESERIVARGEEQLASQRSAVVRELRTEIGTLAVDLSTQIVNQRLADEQQVSATVDAFLAELERDGAAHTDGTTTTGAGE
ncbi:F0F1 ATP synthase subunit B [Jatrophihabitans endophyticus]|uniref:F0F1 ATP synthase subunit B n=1 Tax=Jatrophihabitans endophyticus TaxID=1206085 RepID=UPI0019FF1A71|nr:F0F1 ATP synthase subunit B [Jatrophihabitans endophyticus]MBE7188863.1 F0F1 ATP synthase subunit B [Jatrophihabitans endophyticus]